MTVNAKIPSPNYHCQQEELTGVCLIGWNNCSDNITFFSTFNSQYTTGYITTKLTALQAARNLPSASQRVQNKELSRIQLVLKTDLAVVLWQYLKSYILKSFPKTDHKTLLDAAGAQYYTKASKYNWEKLDSLLNQGSQFIINNNAALIAGGMPANFQTDYEALRVQLLTVFIAFKKAEQDSEEQTAEKINAYNAIFNDLMQMFKDGQLIFKKQPKTKEKFIFEQVLELIRGASNIYKEFKIKKGESKTIKKVVANSAFENIGTVPLLLCSGTEICTSSTGILVEPETSVIVPADSKIITVTNTSADVFGYCKVRVTQK